MTSHPPQGASRAVQRRDWMIFATNPHDRDDEREALPLFWSNIGGWVPIEDADVFTQEERSMWQLPVGGQWVSLPAALTVANYDYAALTARVQELEECLRMIAAFDSVPIPPELAATSAGARLARASELARAALAQSEEASRGA